MKKIIAVAVAAMMAIIVPSSCSHKPQAGTTAEISQQQLMERAAELCQYIPDHELRAGSEAYLTVSFSTIARYICL